eukprot:346280-Ditylum_brightwellii.AAC.1
MSKQHPLTLAKEQKSYLQTTRAQHQTLKKTPPMLPKEAKKKEEERIKKFLQREASDYRLATLNITTQINCKISATYCFVANINKTKIRNATNILAQMPS